MASSNPFRRKSTTITATESTTFGGGRFPSLDEIDTSGTPPPRTSFYGAQLPEAPVEGKKNKIVKKVRVLSPPPLSPDSPEWAFAAPPLATVGSQPPNDADPFEGASTDDSDREIVPAASPQNSSRAPANPFSKTLKDIEGAEGEHELEAQRRSEGAALKAGNMSRRSLDVNSFKRLLMTGNSGSSTSPTPPRAQQLRLGHQRSATESFSSSQASTFGGVKDAESSGSELHEASLISHEASETPSELDDGSVSDSSMSVQMSRGKKPPPPPSSRHGKSIRLELKDDGNILDGPRSKSPSDMNKPLPPAPLRQSFEDDGESPFDRESAGKIPEVDAPAATQTPGKKAVPAPPPRRGHSRAESKAFTTSISNMSQTVLKSHDDEPPSRSSMDSTRSRDRKVYDTHAPAPPPPPRRSYVGSRQSSHILSPVPDTFGIEQSPSPSILHSEPERSSVLPPSYHTTSLDPSTIRDPHAGNLKPFAPPPPPARNPSVRRPASVRSIESTSRRVSAETKPHNSVAPPPPPRRQRGDSRGSLNEQQQQQQRRTSHDNNAAKSSPTLEEVSPPTPEVTADGPVSPQSAGTGVDILADLTALQREVDALRGKLK
ncbi:Fc.00g028580.m01.CDS01 [Cosmosporella sp. VM-42]